VEPRKIKKYLIQNKKENTMKTKRILAILLVVMFIMSAFPMVALATVPPVPVPTGISVNGQTLTIRFGTCPLDDAATLVPANFTVVVADPDDLDTDVTAAVVTNATTVTLTLADPVPYDATGVTVTYAGTALVCEDDVAVAGFGPLGVTVATPPPLTQVHDDSSADILVPEITYTQFREATLPTSVPFTFVLDPQGLYGMTNDQIRSLVVEPGVTGGRLGRMAIVPCTAADCPDHDDGGDDSGTCNEDEVWQLLPTAGQIIFSNYAPHFINNSNFDVALEIEFSFDDNDTGDTVATAATPGAVSTDADPRVFIGATFSAENVQAAPTGFSGGSLMMPVLHAAQKPVFILGAAEYDDFIEITRVPDTPTGSIQSIVVEQRKDKVTGNNGHGTQFRLSGRCNPDADWSDIDAADLSISITFTLTTPPTAPAHAWSLSPAQLTALGAAATPVAIPGAYGLVAGNSLAAVNFILPASGFLGTPAFPVGIAPDPWAPATVPAAAWARQMSIAATGAADIPLRLDAGVTITSIHPSANPTNIFAAGGVDYSIGTAEFGGVTVPVLTISAARMATMRGGQTVGASISWTIHLSNGTSLVLTWNMVA
jgi:hypothetical protein